MASSRGRSETAVKLGNRMREARRRSKLTIASVAESLGRDENTVWRWEKGYMRIAADDLLRLARLYDASVAWLLDDERGNSVPVLDLQSFLAEEWEQFIDSEKEMVSAAIQAAREAKGARAVYELDKPARDDALDDLLELYAKASADLRSFTLATLRNGVQNELDQAQHSGESNPDQ